MLSLSRLLHPHVRYRRSISFGGKPTAAVLRRGRQHRNWNLTKTIGEAIAFMERDVARHFNEIVTNGLGAANTTEFLFVANPLENSLIRGTLNVLIWRTYRSKRMIG